MCPSARRSSLQKRHEKSFGRAQVERSLLCAESAPAIAHENDTTILERYGARPSFPSFERLFRLSLALPFSFFRIPFWNNKSKNQQVIFLLRWLGKVWAHIRSVYNLSRQAILKSRTRNAVQGTPYSNAARFCPISPLFTASIARNMESLIHWRRLFGRLRPA